MAFSFLSSSRNLVNTDAVHRIHVFGKTYAKYLISRMVLLAESFRYSILIRDGGRLASKIFGTLADNNMAAVIKYNYNKILMIAGNNAHTKHASIPIIIPNFHSYTLGV